MVESSVFGFVIKLLTIEASRMDRFVPKTMVRCLERRWNLSIVPMRALRGGGFFPNLLPRSLPRQGLFHSTLFTRLEVIRVTFHFSNDVFRQNFALESTERIFYGFALLQSNFCHAYPPTCNSATRISYCRTFV